MTQDKAKKKAVRQQMAQTGEPYNVARRSIESVAVPADHLIGDDETRRIAESFLSTSPWLGTATWQDIVVGPDAEYKADWDGAFSPETELGDGQRWSWPAALAPAIARGSARSRCTGARSSVPKTIIWAARGRTTSRTSAIPWMKTARMIATDACRGTHRRPGSGTRAAPGHRHVASYRYRAGLAALEWRLDAGPVYGGEWVASAHALAVSALSTVGWGAGTSLGRGGASVSSSRAMSHRRRTHSQLVSSP
jgi:hypothetical protein